MIKYYKFDDEELLEKEIPKFMGKHFEIGNKKNKKDRKYINKKYNKTEIPEIFRKIAKRFPSLNVNGKNIKLDNFDVELGIYTRKSWSKWKAKEFDPNFFARIILNLYENEIYIFENKNIQDKPSSLVKVSTKKDKIYKSEKYQMIPRNHLVILPQNMSFKTNIKVLSNTIQKYNNQTFLRKSNYKRVTIIFDFYIPHGELFSNYMIDSQNKKDSDIIWKAKHTHKVPDGFLKMPLVNSTSKKSSLSTLINNNMKPLILESSYINW